MSAVIPVKLGMIGCINRSQYDIDHKKSIKVLVLSLCLCLDLSLFPSLPRSTTYRSHICLCRTRLKQKSSFSKPTIPPSVTEQGLLNTLLQSSSLIYTRVQAHLCLLSHSHTHTHTQSFSISLSSLISHLQIIISAPYAQ